MSVPMYTQPQQQSRQSRRRFWLIAGGLIAIGVIGFTVLVGFAVISALNTVKQSGPIPARYYLNFISQDYAQAYTYLDSNATINGQRVGDEQSFVNLAKAADAKDGRVVGVTLNGGDAPNVTVTIQRGSRHYDVHLQLKQEGGTWKIISADGI